MTPKLTLNATVTYADVDQYEQMLLARAFKLLQDAAIAHANQFGTGTNAVAERAESWVLNRIAADIDRYPRPGEALRVETWSTGINGFKGYREFRVYDASERQILAASSLWLYISLRTKSIIRVPREVADTFPVGGEQPWCPELERLALPEPDSAAPACRVSLRFSDFDVNEHVNNAAYFDLLQTALVTAGASAHPRHVRLKYARAIPLDAGSVEIRVQREAETVRFSMEREGVLHAQGQVG